METKILSVAKLADLIGVEKTMIGSMINQNFLPDADYSIAAGRIRLWRYDSIIKWLDDNCVIKSRRLK